jgi:hypothetical protein
MKNRLYVVLGALLVAVLGCVLAIAVADGLLWKKGPPPQIVTLPNGEEYQFAGTTYGTTPVPPSLAARAVSWLPTPLAERARKRFAGTLSQNRPGVKFLSPRLIVWFRRLGTNAVPASPGLNLNVMLADKAGVTAGQDGLAGYPTGTAWLFAAFSIVPRRSRELECYFSREFDDLLVGKVSFLNPLYSQFPQWQPESLPTLKRVEDLEVRLDRLETGYLPPGLFGTNLTRKPLFRLGPKRGSSVMGSVFHISLRSSAGSNTWSLGNAVLSDATGNRLLDPAGPTQLRRTDWGDSYSKLIRGTLWPDEAAWRLKLEFYRPPGGAAGDLVTFSNVPILKTDASKPIKRTAAFGPYQVVLEEATVRSGYGVWFLAWRVELLNAPDGLAAEVNRATADTGMQLSVHQETEARPGGGQNEQFAILSGVPSNATAVDLTCAIQKKRTVEFLVKPPKPQ